MAFLRSHLERISVSKDTMRTYLVFVTEFVDRCRLLRVDWETDAEMDTVLVYVLDQMFFDGRPGHDATTLVAALRWYMPRFRRRGEGHPP